MREADYSEWYRRGGVFIRQVQRHAVHDGLQENDDDGRGKNTVFVTFVYVYCMRSGSEVQLPTLQICCV